MAAWSTVTVVLLACVCGAFAQSFCCIYGSQVVNSHAAPEYQFASCLSNQCPAHYSFQLYGFYMVGNCTAHCPIANISGSDFAYSSSSTGAVVSSGSYYGSTFTAVATLPLFTGTGSSTTATSSASGSTTSASMSSTNGGNSGTGSSSPSMSSSSNTSPSTKSNDAVDADQDAFERDGGKRNLLSLPEATSGSWNCQYDAITSTAALPVATQPLHGCPPWHLGTCYNMTYPNQMSCTFLGFTIPAPAPPPPVTSTTSTTGTGTTSTGTTGSGTTTNPVTTATSATTTQATTATSATTTPGTSTTGAATTGAATSGAATTGAATTSTTSGSTTGTTTASSASSSVTTSSPNNTESEAALADSSEEILEFNPNGKIFCCDYQYVSSTGSLKAFYHLPNETGCPTSLLDEIDCSEGQCYLISFWLVDSETECTSTSPGTNVCSEFDGECGSCGYVPGCSYCLDDNGTCQASATASCSAAGLITDPSAATCANTMCANSILGATGSYEEITYNCTTTPVAYSFYYQTCSICSTPNGMGGYSLTCFAEALAPCAGAIDNGVASNMCSMYGTDCNTCNGTAGCSFCPNANSNTGNCNMCSVTKAATSGALTCGFEACAVAQTCAQLPASCMTYQSCSSCSAASSCKWCNNQCFDSSDMTCNASKCPSGSDIVDILIVVGILVVCGGICLGCYAYRRRSRSSYQPVGNVNYEGGYNNNFNNNNQYAPNNYGAANNAFGNAPRSGGYALGAPPQGAPGATYPPLQPQGPAYQRGGPQFQSGVAAPRQAGNFYGDT